MIHLIYIYFIVNAFVAGAVLGNRDGVSNCFVALFVGLPYYGLIFIYAVFEALVVWIVRVTIIKGWYRLYFTDYFSNLDDMTVKIHRHQYYGLRKDGTNTSWLGKIFLRQIDKKYNYGITRKEGINDNR